MNVLGIFICLFGVSAALYCKVGDKTVKDHIVSECYTSSTAYRGIKPIACTPSNSLTDQIKPGIQHKTDKFVFVCEQDGNTMKYEIINCIADNQVMKVNSEYTDKDGGVYKCARDASGVVNFNYEVAQGCMVQGKLHPINKDIFDGEKVYRCYFSHNKYITALRGCAVLNEAGKNVVIMMNRIGQADGKTYKCNKDEKHSNSVSIEELDYTCKYGKEKYNLLETWMDTDKTMQYTCTLEGDKVDYVASACIYKLRDAIKVIKINGFLKLDKSWQHCEYQKGFGHKKCELVSLKGGHGTTECLFPDGKYYQLFSWKLVDGVQYTCYYNGKAYTKTKWCDPIESIGKSVKILRNTIAQTSPKEAFACQHKEGTSGDYELRKLSDKEFKDWKSGGFSISASGGQGAGQRVTTTSTVPPATAKMGTILSETTTVPLRTPTDQATTTAMVTPSTTTTTSTAPSPETTTVPLRTPTGPATTTATVTPLTTTTNSTAPTTETTTEPLSTTTVPPTATTVPPTTTRVPQTTPSVPPSATTVPSSAAPVPPTITTMPPTTTTVPPTTVPPVTYTMPHTATTLPPTTTTMQPAATTVPQTTTTTVSPITITMPPTTTNLLPSTTTMPTTTTTVPPTTTNVSPTTTTAVATTNTTEPPTDTTATAPPTNLTVTSSNITLQLTTVTLPHTKVTTVSPTTTTLTATMTVPPTTSPTATQTITREIPANTTAKKALTTQGVHVEHTTTPQTQEDPCRDVNFGICNRFSQLCSAADEHSPREHIHSMIKNTLEGIKGHVTVEERNGDHHQNYMLKAVQNMLAIESEMESLEKNEEGCQSEESNPCTKSSQRGSSEINSSEECKKHKKTCGCHQKRQKPCKQCGLLARTAQELVRSVCPRKCNVCHQHISMNPALPKRFQKLMIKLR